MMQISIKINNSSLPSQRQSKEGEYKHSFNKNLHIFG